jgi:hypothetical protein
MFVRDEDAIYELQLYLAIMVVLLALRLPFVREAIKRVRERQARRLA